ncbi:helix-turn-helix domain-containing protein [Corynebacterium pilosum]|uniref:DNA-binding protein, excisionase family n=1 Tax=Corynebacterium pilosum TaxID=35756 RepID=A0A376CJT7_9CORY|nr:helix-turn-helix domain-containing protein [Corynebacterium pilosum]STC68532.1 DNA-binding protein, excisionase family [Corynebacterium pilosum]
MIATSDNDRKEAVILPPDSDDMEQLHELAGILESACGDAVLIGPDGHETAIPEQVSKVLVGVVDAMAHGRAITLTPIDTKLTTQEAADFLEISRPTLIKLLEKGRIPYEKMPESRHRRILLTDLVEYRQAHKERQVRILDLLVEDAEEAGLYQA